MQIFLSETFQCPICSKYYFFKDASDKCYENCLKEQEEIIQKVKTWASQSAPLKYLVNNGYIEEAQIICRVKLKNLYFSIDSTDDILSNIINSARDQ